MNKQNNQKPITSNEVSGIGSPITAWAVEIEGKIDPSVCTTRAEARYVRRIKSKNGTVDAHVRKVEIQVVKGR